MRGSDKRTGSLFSYVNLEERVPARHPLRKIKSGRSYLACTTAGCDGDATAAHPRSERVQMIVPQHATTGRARSRA